MEKIVCLFVIALSGASTLTFGVENRITSGHHASENQFPYSVSLQQLTQLQTITRGHRCGGVLITYQHVLTTASCTFNTVNGVREQIKPSEYRVFAGSAHLTNDSVQDRIRFIANFTVYPGYTGAPAFVNDIAIITLNVPFASTTAVPLALPSSDFGPADFALCNLAGWGAQNLTASASSELRYTSKYIYSQSLCSSLYSSLPGHVNIFPTMICAASYDIVSSGCTGDQGNALVCNRGLVGILFLTNNCTASSFPEVYTRVSNYTLWIRSVTGGTSASKPAVVMLAIFAVAQIIAAKVIS